MNLVDALDMRRRLQTTTGVEYTVVRSPVLNHTLGSFYVKRGRLVRDVEALQASQARAQARVDPDPQGALL